MNDAWTRPDVPEATIRLRLSTSPAGHCVLRVRGEIDEPDAVAIHDRALPLLEPGATVVIDLSEVGFMGSFGLNTLVRLAQAAEQVRARVAVATGPANRAVRRPITIAGVDRALPVVDDVADVPPIA